MKLLQANQSANHRNPGRALRAARLGFALLVALTAGTGCVNSRMPSFNAQQLSGGGGGAGGASGPSGPSTVDQFYIGNVVPAPAPSGTTTATPVNVSIYFDPSHGVAAGGGTTPPIMTQHCSASTNGGGNGKPCVCQYIWSETNSSTGNSTPITRTVQTDVSNVQQQLVSCNSPDVYLTEIADGTSIKITVLPGPGNPDASLFSVNTYILVKNTQTSAGSFQDAQGHAFENIVHYSCYEQFKIGTSITNKIGTKSNPQTGEQTNFPVANQFCVQKAGQAATADCPGMPPNLTNSVQAYYYNFFARVSVVGEVNQWNDRYTCPKVKEPIYNPGGVGTQGSLYPMDTNFALSVNSTPTFNIGVNGFIELADGGGDPITALAKTCDGQAPAGNSSTDGFVQGCLGFATKPNSDGTCPSIRDSSGAVRFTYRLRRFIALYPPLFDISGKAPTTPQRTDTIYVLDRPVTPPSGANPLSPYTMRGPKPCPFAIFDAKGVTKTYDALYPNQAIPTYSATNNSAWNGLNADGIQLPNTDGPQSCSAAMPLTLSNDLIPSLTTITIGTVNQFNPVMQKVYIRPIRAWAPHYEEDLSFQACAPQASPTHDPPLHFSKDLTTGNVAWCAEDYPSQNDNVPALDLLYNQSAPASTSNTYIGHVAPFTSHVVKNSLSADCTATVPSSIPAVTVAGNVYPAKSGGTPNPPNAACVAPNASPSGLAYHPADALVDTKNTYALVPPYTQTPRNVCSNQTCDRTAIATGGPGWTQFPLLARANHVEQAIASDSTYGCVMTYDGGGPKTGKSTPSAGCCGANVLLQTGLAAPGANNPPGLQNTTAHLEPDMPCLIPAY